jgi:hypothetical protein
LRGLALTTLAGSRLNPKALQRLLGHADVQTTQNLYVQVTDSLRDQAKVAMETILDECYVGRGTGRKWLNWPKTLMGPASIKSISLLRM